MAEGQDQSPGTVSSVPLQPPRATPSVRRRSPAAVVLGGALVLASAVLVAGGVFVAGFGSLVAGGALLVRPARERRRRSRERRTPAVLAGRVVWRGTVRAAKLSRTLVVRLAPAARAMAHGTALAAAASGRALAAASEWASDFGATAGCAFRRAGRRAWRTAVELRDRVGDAWAEGRQRASSRLRPALRAGRQSAQSAVRASVPVVRGWARGGVDAATAAGRRAGAVARRTRSGLRSAARSEAAHLGIVTMPPAQSMPGEQGGGRDAEPPAGGQAAPAFPAPDSAGGEEDPMCEPAVAPFRGGVVPDAAEEPPGTAEEHRAENAPAGDAAAAPEPAGPSGHEDSGAVVPTGDGTSQRKSKSVESAPPTPQRPRRATKRTPRTTTPKGGRAPHESR